MAQLIPCLSEAQADGIFLRLDATNNPLTGELKISPSSGENAIDSQKDITLKDGQKVRFDGL